MASTYSPNLRLELIGTGEQQGTWGQTTNTNLGTLLEEAIGGYVSVTVSDSGDTTLTTVNGGVDQSRNMVINLTGTISAARNVICPAIEKLYVVKNATSGGYAVTFKVSGQTGVSVPNGSTVFLYVDGTDVRPVTTSLASQSPSNVAITGGSITGVTGVVVTPNNSAQGDILYYTGSTWARLAAGTSGLYLKTGGANADPVWAAAVGEYYSQNTIPSSASNAAVWYETSGNKLYMRANSDWWLISGDATTNKGIFAGGYNSASSSVIDYVNISTAGNASTFGSLTVAREGAAGCSSRERGLFGGGNSGGNPSNTIDYITISVGLNAVDFGDLTVTRSYLGACSNGTRGIFGGGGGVAGSGNVIDYVTIATTGNATDFGDLLMSMSATSACSNGTRGVFGGTATAPTNTMNYITIATAGNATDFGDLTVGREAPGSCSNGTRGVFAGGVLSPSSVYNVIDYITIATTGNATNFGNLTAVKYALGGCSNGARGLFGGGYSGGYLNVIDYITIATAGNAADFGDLTVARTGPAALSGFYGA